MVAYQVSRAFLSRIETQRVMVHGSFSLGLEELMSITRSNKVVTLVVTCLGFFIVLLDSSIIVMALPTIQADLHLGMPDMLWVVNANTLPFAAFMLTADTLSGRFGRKRLFLIGLVLFVLGSVWCGVAPTFAWFLCGRVIQGLGAAALSPGSLSVLVAAFSEPRERTQAVGLWSGISGIALAVGPLVGGWILQITSWPVLFFINVPIGLTALALGWPLLSESRSPNPGKIDVTGQVLLVAGLTCLLLGAIGSFEQGWASMRTIGLGIGAGVLLIAFLLVETRVREPLLPVQLWKNPVFLAGNLTGTALGFTVLVSSLFMVQYFQDVQGFTAFEAGLRILPITMGTFVVAPLSGILAARVGVRLPATLGAVLAGVALVLLSRLRIDLSFADLWWNLALLGFGFGFLLSSLTAAVLSATPPEDTSLGSTMITSSRQIGVTLGIAILGSFVVQRFAVQLTIHVAENGGKGPVSVSVAATGAQAASQPLAQQLALGSGEIPQVVHQAFVEALQGAFLIGGVVMLSAALLAGVLLRQKRSGVQGQGTESSSHIQASEVVSNTHYRMSIGDTQEL